MATPNNEQWHVLTIGRECYRIRAATIEQAAGDGARMLHGNRASAHRVTGTPGLSGVFQACLPLRRRGGEPPSYTSAGAPFHVRPL